MTDIEEERRRMVRHQLAERGIRDERVLRVMSELPRDLFVPGDVRHLAYEDCALPLGEGQTISQPYMVAAMAEALQLTGEETVLEIGTGSGYAAAVLGRLAKRVISVERQPALAEQAAARLRAAGFANVTVILADGTAGWPPAAPYEAISVAAGAPEVPQALAEQLAGGGRLVIPIGAPRHQVLVRLTRTDEGYRREELMPCVFVPLVGSGGWANPE